MLRCRKAFPAILLVGCLCSCSNAVDSALAQHEDITAGTFNGFAIGSSKLAALAQARVLNAFAIEIPPGQEQNSAACPSAGGVFNVRTLSPPQTKVVLACDLWKFETTNTPHGEFYELHFTRGSLIEVKYMRPRIQVN